jgi:hypothetical protein
MFCCWGGRGEDLRISIEGMEGMRSVRGRNNPFMMGFVKSFVHQRVVETSMNQVDQTICEDEE